MTDGEKWLQKIRGNVVLVKTEAIRGEDDQATDHLVVRGELREQDDQR